MRTSIATVCLSGGPVEKQHACAEASFDGVEVFEPDLVEAPESPDEIRALADRLEDLDLYQPFRDAEGVDVIPLIAHGGRTTMAGWGGVLSAAAKARGIEGVVVDGAVRDVDEARDLDFSMHARAAVPVTARGRVRERDWNVPVEVAGVSVKPGDWVIADSSGVVFIEGHAIDEILDVAETVTAHERTMVEQLRAGTPVSEVMGTRYENLLEEQ